MYFGEDAEDVYSSQSNHSEDSDEAASPGPSFHERKLTEPALDILIDKITYSTRYTDDQWEYRHVILPKALYNQYVPDDYKNRILKEKEWRWIGMSQSLGWYHYLLHEPEPHIFLFRRDLPMVDGQAQEKEEESQQVSSACSDEENVNNEGEELAKANLIIIPTKKFHQDLSKRSKHSPIVNLKDVISKISTRVVEERKCNSSLNIASADSRGGSNNQKTVSGFKLKPTLSGKESRKRSASMTNLDANPTSKPGPWKKERNRSIMTDFPNADPVCCRITRSRASTNESDGTLIEKIDGPTSKRLTSDIEKLEKQVSDDQDHVVMEIQESNKYEMKKGKSNEVSLPRRRSGRLSGVNIARQIEGTHRLMQNFFRDDPKLSPHFELLLYRMNWLINDIFLVLTHECQINIETNKGRHIYIEFGSRSFSFKSYLDCLHIIWKFKRRYILRRMKRQLSRLKLLARNLEINF